MTVDALTICAILFDLDDTLHDFSHSERMAQIAFCEAHAARHGLQPERVMATLLEHNTRELAEWFDRRDSAKRTMVEYRTLVLGATLGGLGHTDVELEEVQALAEEFERERRRHFRIYEDSHACLQALKGRYKLGLISNGPRDSQRRNAEQAGVLGFFELVLIEGEIGLSKPEPEIFLLACERLGVAPAETLMVGDSLANDIAGAAGAGLKTAWLDRPDAVESPSKAYSAGLVGQVRPDVTVGSLVELAELLMR